MTPIGIELRKIVASESDPDALLIGKSGCGKTSAIFDAAMTKYCVLFTATSDAERKPSSRKDPGSLDYSFMELVVDTRNIVQSKELSFIEMKTKCDSKMLALIVSRMLTLHAFTKREHNNSPKDWLVYQLTRGVHNVIGLLYQSLSKRKPDFLKALRNQLELELTFFYAFDEAQSGYELLKEESIWERENGDKIGIASPFLDHLGTHPAVVAGTALSLHSVACCKSDLGKRGTYYKLDDFPSVSLGEVKLKLSEILNLDGVELSDVEHLWKLEGRGRLVGGLLAQLAEEVAGETTPSKKVMLQQAIKKHYNKMRNDLKSRIKDQFVTTGKASPLMHNAVPTFPECLESLAISCLLGGTISKLVDGLNIDLLHGGLCSLKNIDDADTYVLDEELGKDALLDLAQDYCQVAKNFAKVALLCRPAAGHAMEPLLVAELRAWSSGNDGATVSSFLFQLFDGPLPPNMPTWIEHSKFSVAGGFEKRNLTPHGIANDVGFVAAAFKNGNLRNRLLSPSTVKRPDFEAVMEGTRETDFWFLSVSSKFYSTPYDDSDGSDLRSTDPTMFYMKKNGDANRNCRHLRASWETLYDGQQDFFKRNLRIHFCLPDVERPESNSARVFIDNTSIVAYITAANVSNIFRSNTVAILSEIGCMPATTMS